MLAAGAGYGKTTLLEQALDGGPPAAWVRCSEADRDSSYLLMRVVEALAVAAPGTTDALAERLATTLEQVDSAALAAELTAELERLLVEPVVLVLDDAERLDGAAGSLALLGRLLHADLACLRVVVASRRGLDLPLAKRRADGSLTELGPADLAFNAEECAALLRAQTGVDPSDEQVRLLMEATEGWPLGMVLAAGQLERRQQGGDGAAQVGGLRSVPALRAYLSEELLDSLDPELRDAAIRSSAAERVTAAVARALDLPEGLAARLERAGLLVRRTGTDGAFEYHPLLREFLRERLATALDVETRRGVHAQVAHAAAEDGDPVAALEHWIAAEAWNDAAAAIEREGLALVRTSPTLVRGWIERLPADVRGQPGLRALEGQSWWLAGDYSRAIPALRDAVRGFGSDPDPPAEWLARSILVDALFAVGDPDGIEPAVEGWDRPDAAGAFALAPAAALFAAFALASFARFEESDRLAGTALREADRTLLGPLDALRRFVVDLPAGHADEACARLEAAVRELERFDPLNRRVHVLGVLATALGERGDRENALRLWLSTRDATRGSVPVLADATHAWCALLHAQAGRLDEAEAELAQHRRLEAGIRSFVADLAPAAVASLRGDAQATEAAASAALVTVASGPILIRYWVGADLVPALAGVGSRGRAAEVLRDTLTLVDEAYPGERGRLLRGRLLALRAWLAHLDGDEAGADEALIEAREAAGEAFRHVLRREWQRLEPVAWGALERDRIDPAATIAELDSAFPGGLRLVPFLQHPNAGVRAAALGPAVRSGDPAALAALERLRTDPSTELAEAATRARAQLARMLPPLRFSVLGRFGVARGSWRITDADWARPADARLVRFLLTRLGAPVPEDLIFEALWPGLEPKNARRSLHVAASRARKLLDLPGAEPTAIEAGDHSYRLALGERDGVDAEEFRNAATAALAATGEDRRARLERAQALWTGEPLVEERYSDWAASYRERLSDLHVAVLTGLVAIHERSDDHAAASAAARALVDVDPLNEGAHRALMTAYARAGRTGHALRQYLECRRTLVEELGIEPAEATSRLQARILAGEQL
jgi:LuxR family maltose regulon positive regulatory protein